MDEDERRRLHRMSTRSKELLKKAQYIGCFSCLNRFTFDDIDTFVDVGQTALCPFCDIDAVIPLNELGTESEQDTKLAYLNRYFF